MITKGCQNITHKKNMPLVSFVSHCAEKDGAERSLLDIIDYFVNQNVLVHVILPSKGPLEEELKKRSVAYNILHFPWWINSPKGLIDDNFKAIIRSSVELAKILEQVNPDIVYSNSSVSSAGALAAAMIKKPHIWHITEFGLREHGTTYNLEEKVRKSFINNYSDKIIFTSNALRKDYEGFIDDKKTEVVYNFAEAEKSVGVKKKKYFNNPKSFKILVLGNIQQGKNQKEALLALKELTKDSPSKNIELLIVGKTVSKEYYKEIKKFIGENKLDKKVKLIDYVAEPHDIMEETDIVLVCSRNEAFGRVTIEAFNLNKPVIGASSGATVELIKDKINGFLYTPGDYKELAKKISYFFDNRNELLKYGEKGYDFAKSNFSKDKTLSKIYNLTMKLNKDFNKKNLNPEHLVLNEMFMLQKDQLEETSTIKAENEQLRKEDKVKGDHIKSLEMIVKKKDDQITKMKSSKLWKTRELIARANRKFR
jgi:glycosyltransferase involved in cell wall biosynthesis